MQFSAPQRREGVVHRAAEELVTKRHSVTVGHQDTGGDADLHLLGCAQDQRRIGARRHDRQQLGELTGGRGQARIRSR